LAPGSSNDTTFGGATGVSGAAGAASAEQASVRESTGVVPDVVVAAGEWVSHATVVS
jgi:hypothetical protein